MSLLSTKFSEHLRNPTYEDIEVDDFQYNHNMKVLDNWDKYRTKMEDFIQNSEFVWMNYSLPDKTLTKYTFCKIEKNNISCCFESNELNVDKWGQRLMYQIDLEYSRKGCDDRICRMILNSYIYTDTNESYLNHSEEYNFDCAKKMYKTLKKMIESE